MRRWQGVKQRGEEENREEGEMVQKKNWEEGEIGGKSREEGENVR